MYGDHAIEVHVHLYIYSAAGGGGGGVLLSIHVANRTLLGSR